MRIAVDVCIGKRGLRILQDAGHEIVTEAGSGEMDRVWFARALEQGVEMVISPDTDLEILCYDYRIRFFRAPNGWSDVRVAYAVVRRLEVVGP